MGKKGKKSIAQLVRELDRLQKKSLVNRTKRASSKIGRILRQHKLPESVYQKSTRFQLELDIAARKAAKKKTRQVKKKGRKAILSYLSDLKAGRA